MVAYFVGCWMFGLVWVGLLSALAPSEVGWVAMLGRAVYVGGVGVMLGVTAVIVASSTSYAALSPSQNGLWAYSIGAAIPVTLLAYLVVRRTVPRPLLVAVATLPAIAVLLAAPEAFRVWGVKLDGLALAVHEHHWLVVAALGLSTAVVAVGGVVAGRAPEASAAVASYQG